jgi:AcrR family transcriptional regulator
VSVFAGQGDPVRSMALLWGEPEERRPGPKPALTLAEIVASAITVADEKTLAGLSMRAVAQRLGCSTMALYTYVPGKAELLDVMYDRAHAELSADHDHHQNAGWRPAVESWAAELQAFYLRHPWVVRVSFARPVLGPHEQATLETLLRLLTGTGLPAQVLRGVVAAIFHLVRGAARTAAEYRDAAGETGTADQEWWSARAAELARRAPDFADRFPLSVRLGREGGPPEPDAAFTTGLALLLDGVEARISR